MKATLREILFEAKSSGWKRFEIFLMLLIITSVIVVMLESVPDYTHRYAKRFWYAEIFFTMLFSIEYVLRIWASKKPLKYIFSFYWLIDLFTILPTYLTLLLPSSAWIWFIRWLRLLRVFRIFKMWWLVKHYKLIKNSLSNSRDKIIVFMIFVVLMVAILWSIMYLVEWWENSTFDSIPRSIYRAIVTLTTVWYGDITPTTMLGQFLSSVVMILWYAVLAVPTWIITSDLVAEARRNDYFCKTCNHGKHEHDARYCKKCWEVLD